MRSNDPGALVMGVLLPAPPHADDPVVCGKWLAPPRHAEFPVVGRVVPVVPPPPPPSPPQALACVLDVVVFVPTPHAVACGVDGALPAPPHADVPVAGGILLAPPQAFSDGPDAPFG